MSHPALRGLQLLVITVVFSLATAITTSAATRVTSIKQITGGTMPMFDAYLKASAPCNLHQSDIELNISKNDKAPIETFATETITQGTATGLDTPATNITLPGDALRGVLKRTSHARTGYLPDDLFSAAIKYHGDTDIYSGINAMKYAETRHDSLHQTALDILSGPSTSQTTGIFCPSRGGQFYPHRSTEHRPSFLNNLTTNQ